MKSISMPVLLTTLTILIVGVGTASAVLPSGNGQTTKAYSVSVAPASDATWPISGAVTATIDTSLLATSAKQDTAQTSLTTIAASAAGSKTAGQATMANSVPVVLASNDTNTLFGTKTGAVTVQSSATNVLNVLPEAVYNTSAPAPSNGNQVPLQADSAGNLKGAEQFQPVFEDNTIGVAVVEHRYSSDIMSTATTKTIKSGPGLLHTVNVGTCVSLATISLFNNTVGSGTSIGVITCPASTGGMPTFIYDQAFSTGLTAVTSGATNVSFSFR